MSIEQQAGTIQLEHPIEMARLLTMAGFIIAAPRLADPSEREEGAFTFYTSIAESVARFDKPRWPSGDTITEQECSNYAAGHLLFGLKDVLTYRKPDAQRARVVAQNEVNPLLGPTFKTLTRVGLLNKKDNCISKEFLQFAPALHAVAEACRKRLPTDDSHPLQALQPYMPNQEDFTWAFRQNLPVLRTVVSTAPAAKQTVYSLSNAMRTTGVPLPTVPDYPEAIDWKSRPPIFEQRRVETVSFYKNLHTKNAALYLTHLLDDVEKLDGLLKGQAS